MTNIFEEYLEDGYEVEHGPDEFDGESIAVWLAEYVIDNCKVNDSEPMTLDEAFGAYSIVMRDGTKLKELRIDRDDLGEDGVELYNDMILEFIDEMNEQITLSEKYEDEDALDEMEWWIDLRKEGLIRREDFITAAPAADAA